MSQPPEGFNPAPSAGQTKTMFYTEGNPAAILVTLKGRRLVQSAMTFPQAESALAWCRQNGANLFYMAVRIEGN